MPEGVNQSTSFIRSHHLLLFPGKTFFLHNGFGKSAPIQQMHINSGPSTPWFGCDPRCAERPTLHKERRDFSELQGEDQERGFSKELVNC